MKCTIYLILGLLTLSSPFAVGKDTQRKNRGSKVPRQNNKLPISSSSKITSTEQGTRSLNDGTDPLLWRKRGSTIKGRDEFVYAGAAVDVSHDGDVIIVGSPYADNKNLSQTGLARVFQYDYNVSDWIQMGDDLMGEDEDDEIAETVRLSGEGLIAAISSEEHDESRGHVRVYEYDLSLQKWMRKGSDIDGKHPSDNAGWGMALSDDGLTLVVGSYDNDEGNTNTTNSTYEDDAGQTRIFRWDSDENDWMQLGQDILGDGNDNHEGWKVDLSHDGNRVITSGLSFDIIGNETKAGRVRVFDYSSDREVWEQVGQSLFGNEPGDEFGVDVSISFSGNIIAIGAGCYYYCDDTRHYVKVYKYDEDAGIWEQIGQTLNPGYSYDNYNGFGSSVSLGLDGLRLAVGAVGYIFDAEGFVTVFDYDESADKWEPLGQPMVVTGGDENDYRVETVALAEFSDDIIIGSPYATVKGLDAAGFASVYNLGVEGVPAGCSDSTLEFQYENKYGETLWKNCKFIAKKPAKRCKDRAIQKTCPATCEAKYPGLCLKNACRQAGKLRYRTAEPILKPNKDFFKCQFVNKDPNSRCVVGVSPKSGIRAGIVGTCRKSCYANSMCTSLGPYSG